MYRVLYRKYRPKTFSDVSGQPQVTVTLKNELKADRIAHAYLFTGSRGTGKTSCAKILAKAINCLDLQDGDPCGKCEVCRGIDDGSILDVVEIDAASNNGVDDIRMLREEANFTPAGVKYRVYIIDEVHMLSQGAFNALLKTLEEPPAHVVFILATTEVHKLPATILSRCQRFDFHRIAPQAIADRLALICEKENVVIDRPAAMLIASISDGGMRDALSLLDQCMSRSKSIDEQVVRDTAGLADREYLFNLVEAIRVRDSAAALEIIDKLYSESKDMARLCDELCSQLRAMMLIKTVKNAHQFLVMTSDEFSQTSEQALAVSLNEILSSIDILQKAYERMMRGVNRRIEMEMAIVRLSSPADLNSGGETAKRVEELTREIERLKSTSPYVNDRTPPTVAAHSQQRTQPMKRPPNMEKLRSEAVPMKQWPEVIEDIKQYSKVIGAAFDGSTAYISGKYVLVDSANDICFEILRKPEQREKMRNSIRKITGKDYSLGRYSYPDEVKQDDPLLKLASDIKEAGIPIEEINNNMEDD